MSDMKLTKEMLEGGVLLDTMVGIFNKDRNKENFAKTMMLLRSSDVWIPCKISMSDRDQANLNNMVDAIIENMGEPVNGGFVNKDEIYTIPQLYKMNEVKYMAVFSSEDKISDMGPGVVKIKKTIVEAVEMAKKLNDIEGIILNPFTEAFILSSTGFDKFVECKSLFEE